MNLLIKSIFVITFTIDKPKIFSEETVTCFKDEGLIKIVTDHSLREYFYWGL